MKINMWNDVFCPAIEVIVLSILVSGYFLFVDFMANFFANLAK